MIRFFTAHPTIANLLMLMFLVLGLISLPNMKRETFPDFQKIQVQVTVPYPGASPEDVEQALCLPIEDALDGIAWMDQLKCSASEGMVTAVAEMADQGDSARFIADIKTEIDAISQFPEQAEEPVVKQLNRYDPVVSLAIAGDMSKPELKLYAEAVKQKLKPLPGVALVEVTGFSDQQLKVELDLPKLRQLGMSVEQVAKRIGQQNVKMPSGNLYAPHRTILLRFDAQKLTPRELGQIIVLDSKAGGQVRLSDIATISQGFELEEQKIEINGQPAALLNIYKAKSDDALDLLATVEEFVQQEQHAVPQQMQLLLTKDMASLAADRLQMLVKNGLQGIILVFLVMWLFFPWRYAVWVSMGLPVSFLGTLFVLTQLGISLNMLSMVALLVAIGLLMDDAIVLSESIATALAKGEKKLDAISHGVSQVINGVLSSFLTTVAIFGSLAFLEGDMGKVLKVIPIVLIITLTVSLIEAFFILPHHLYKAVDTGDTVATRGFKGWFTQKFERFRTVKLPLLIAKIIRYRYQVAGFVLVLFLSSIALIKGGAVQFAAFPDLEGDQVQISLLMPPGTPLAKTEAVIAKIDDDISQVVQTLQEPDLITNRLYQFGQNLAASEQGEHAVTLNLDLKTAELRSTKMAPLLAALQEQIGTIPGALSFIIREPAIGPAGRAIEIELSHPSLDKLQEAGQKLSLYLAQFDGVSNLMSDLRPGKPELQMKLLPGAEVYGVTGQDVAAQLRAAFFGVKVEELQVGQENIELDVRLSQKNRSDRAAFEDFPIHLPDGRQVPLASIVAMEFSRGVSQINRLDNQRTLTLLGDIDSDKNNTAKLMFDVQAEYFPQLRQEFPGLLVHLAGEIESSAQTSGSMRSGFAIGLLVVFAILSFQFRSYMEPVIVMLAIPLGLIGVIWGHFFLGYDLSMPSMLGFASLAGVVVNNSILLVQFIKQDLKTSNCLQSAAILATQQRVRAILITTATTAAGLLPILLERSLQAQILIPLVISLVFGLLASTLLIILVLPAIYGILDDFKLTERHGK